MTKLSITLALAAVAAATNMGCGSSKSTTPGGDASLGNPITPNADGFNDGTNAAGVLGAWFSYGDWYGGDPTTAGGGDCFVKGNYTADKCSSITTPVPGTPFTNTGGVMCTSGTAAKIVDMNYDAIWGAGIAFDLNNAGAVDGAAAAKLPWDATAHGVTGFSFHIDMTGPPTGGQMRVEMPTSAVPGTTDIKSAYWGGETMSLSPFTKPGTYSVHFADVGGPSYLTPHTPFDKTKILSVQFHVVSGTSSAIPYTFCISDVRSLTD